MVAPPLQSRDATATSRYFPVQPSSSGTILVPSSSPLRSDSVIDASNAASAWNLFDDDVPGLTRTEAQARPSAPLADPLTAPSGFRLPPGVSNASSTRPSAANSRKISETEDADEGDRPRKRLNIGPTASQDPIDLLSSSPPESHRTGQRLPGADTSLSSLSSDDSFPDAHAFTNGASKPRIVRDLPRSAEQKPPPSSSPPQPSADEGRFTRFRLTQIEHDTDVVRAAWTEAAGDVPKASALLNDPIWKPKAKTPPPRDPVPATETGRVKEVVEATKAQRLAAKEKGKKSLIYKNRVVSDGKPTSAAGPSTPPPSSKVTPMVVDTPMSPEVLKPRAKRLRKKVVDSDSEPEYVESDNETLPQASRGGISDEQRTLDYFNETSAEGLQELTGASYVYDLWSHANLA